LNGVGYDGCRKSDGTMLEAKYGNAWFIHLKPEVFMKLDGYRQTVNQAFLQNYRSGGRRVEWYFSDPDVAYFWKMEFERMWYTKIHVYYRPYNGLYNSDLARYAKLEFYAA